MKKVNLNGKLSFKKETIAKLNDEQMNSLNGGATNLTYQTCKTCPGQNTTCPPLPGHIIQCQLSGGAKTCPCFV